MNGPQIKMVGILAQKIHVPNIIYCDGQFYTQLIDITAKFNYIDQNMCNNICILMKKGYHTHPKLPRIVFHLNYFYSPHLLTRHQ